MNARSKQDTERSEATKSTKSPQPQMIKRTAQPITTKVKPKEKEKIEICSTVKNKKPDSGKSKVKEPTNNHHQNRENTMSFGPLMSTQEMTSASGGTKSPVPPKPAQLETKQGATGKRTKKEEEEVDMSLLSYEDTDTDNEKYYNEEELTDILGLDQIAKNKAKEQKANTQVKIERKFQNREFIIFSFNFQPRTTKTSRSSSAR